MQKRILTAIIGFILSFSTVWAKNDARKKYNYYDVTFSDLKFCIAAGLNTGDGYEPYTFMAQPYFMLDTTYFQAYGGVQLADDMLHVTAGTVFWPLRQNRFRLGGGIVYHFNYFDDISLCHDLLFNVHFETRPAYWFGLKMTTGYFFKARKIFAVEKDIGFIRNNSIDVSIETDFFLPYNITLFTRVSSYEMFRYMVFCAPSFTFGVNKALGRRVDFTFETTSRYIDFFTASTRYDDTEMRFIVGLHL